MKSKFLSERSSRQSSPSQFLGEAELKPLYIPLSHATSGDNTWADDCKTASKVRQVCADAYGRIRRMEDLSLGG